jgi:hypothetical protein
MRALVVAALLAVTVSGQSAPPWVRVPFDTAGPPRVFRDGIAARPLIRHDTYGPAAACGARGVGWTETPIAAATGNGCYDGAGCYQITICDYRDSGLSPDAWTMGYAGVARGLSPDPSRPLFGRLRLLAVTPLAYSGVGGDSRRQMKFVVWHRGQGGDDRVIVFLESGNNCGFVERSHVCFTLQRNINHASESASCGVPVGTWAHLQWSWQHDPGVLRIWCNRTDQPSAQTSVARWPFYARGYSDEQYDVAGIANTGTKFDGPFVYRIQAFELGPSFDAAWTR